jgi:tetratricopeptide (TPR) repeat protein
LEKAIRCDPERSAAAHCNLGEALLKDGRLDEAVGHLKEALGRRDPNVKVPARAHTLFGNALSIEERPDEAIAHYREAIRLDPKGWAVPYYRLAGALRAKGRSGEAVAHLETAVGLDPGYHSAWMALGKARFEAARAAIADGTGPGTADGPAGESDRVARRRQALAWLQADLKLRAKLVGEGKGIGWDVAVWQTDPALAGVRDAPELAKLPEAESAQWQRLWADVSDVVARSPAADGLAFAAWGDWSRAADLYARSLKRSPTDGGHFWYEFAAVSLLSGDRPGYTRACAHLTEKCGKKDGPRAYHVARGCTLAPDAVRETSLPARLAEKELAESPRAFWSLTERGALAYRAGRYQDAVSFLEQSLAADPKPGGAVVNWLWLALAHHRLGKDDDARRWLARAQLWLDQYQDGMPPRAEEDLGLHLHNWLEACVLRREAEALLRPTGKR